MDAIGYFRQRPGLDRNETLPTLPESESGFFHYCEEQGFQPVASFIDGSSPSPDGERGYFQLCEYLRQPGRGFTAVVIPRLEDLSERPAELLRRVLELEFLGARLVAMEGADADPLEGTVSAWRQRKGHERLSGRAMDALRTKAMRGYGLGKTPYGYRIGESGRLEIVDEEAKVVVEIFRMYVEDGLGLRLIARKLNDAFTSTRRGARWSVVTVRDILRNRTYTGTYIRFGVRVPSNHTPIISNELFREAQKKRESIGGPRTAPRERSFALSGLAICGECGGRMIGVSRRQAWSRKRDGGTTEAEYRYYRCGSRVNQSVCGYHTWRADVLEHQVLGELAGRFEGPPQESQPPRGQVRTSTASRLRSLDTRLERYLEAASRGALALEALRNTALPLVREARRLEARQRGMDPQTDRRPIEGFWWQQQREALRLLRDDWPTLTGEERRFQIGDLLEKVVVRDKEVDVVLSS